MSTVKERRCHECGKGTVRPLAKPGRRERYKTMTLEIPAGIEIPTCDNCGTEWMDEDTAERITRALAILYRERVHELVEAAILVLSEYVKTGEPLDKAGAYAIQGRAAAFAQHLDGSYSGVMGLPLFETAEILSRIGYPVL